VPSRLRRYSSWAGITLLSGGVLVGGIAYITTQYFFQEPAWISWDRLLRQEVRSHRHEYPSARLVFKFLDAIAVNQDPRDQYGPLDGQTDLPAPANWRGLVGPRVDRAEAVRDDVSGVVWISSAEHLRRVLLTVEPGATIQFRPGVYHFSGRSMAVDRPGELENPITLRAAALGEVTLTFDLLEGFRIHAPHWIVENLVIDGVCTDDTRCEHAFHIVGEARSTVLRDNWVTNFNAAVKVNGANGATPDDGLIEHNFFANDAPRDTAKPVTPLDLVAVSGWRVRGNVVADFAKRGGDGISYAAFFKGGGGDNLFEHNLVRCEWRHHGGIRNGLSLGGGGTSDGACRGGSCDAEQRDSVLRGNVILDCPNDVGIYLNKAAGTLIHNNLILNTRGIDVRFPETDAMIANNVIDGRILRRDGGSFTAERNVTSGLGAALLWKLGDDFFANPGAGNLHLEDPGRILGRGRVIPDAGRDLCGQALAGGEMDIGPIQYGRDKTCAPILFAVD
jgi:hypothetical protein